MADGENENELREDEKEFRVPFQMVDTNKLLLNEENTIYNRVSQAVQADIEFLNNRVDNLNTVVVNLQKDIQEIKAKLFM